MTQFQIMISVLLLSVAVMVAGTFLMCRETSGKPHGAIRDAMGWGIFFFVSFWIELFAIT